jgi:hypothetical protein
MRWIALFFWLLLCFAVAGLGGRWTAPEIRGWYRDLRQPVFTPPNLLFGPVWTTLYFLMAIAAWRITEAPDFAAQSWPWLVRDAARIEPGLVMDIFQKARHHRGFHRKRMSLDYHRHDDVSFQPHCRGRCVANAPISALGYIRSIPEWSTGTAQSQRRFQDANTLPLIARATRK